MTLSILAIYLSSEKKNNIFFSQVGFWNLVDFTQNDPAANLWYQLCEIPNSQSQNAHKTLLIGWKWMHCYWSSSLYLLLGVANSWLANDRSLHEFLRRAVPVWKTHLDHQGQGKSPEETVCGLRHRETSNDHQFHQLKLQPPSAAVSVFTSESIWHQSLVRDEVVVHIWMQKHQYEYVYAPCGLYSCLEMNTLLLMTFTAAQVQVCACK